MRRIAVNDDVQVLNGSGLESGVKGYVVPNGNVPTARLPAGTGIPMLRGHYRPMRRDEVAIRDATGRLFTMPRNRLRLI